MEVMSTDSVAAMTSIPSARTGGFGVRLVMRLIDMVAGTIVGSVASAAMIMIIGMLSASGGVDPETLERVQYSGGVLQSLYYGILAAVLAEAVSESIGGATLGKLALGYRVITTDLQACTPQAAIIRSLAYFVDSFFFGLPAWQAMQGSSHNQRLGDKWANTLVVKADAIPEQARRASGLVVIGAVAGVLVHGLVIMMSVLAKVF